MSGELAGAVLEEALKEDKKEREMVWGDPGTRPPAPRPSAPSAPFVTDPVKFNPPPTPVEEVKVEPPPSGNIPDGMKSVLWVPIQNYGETLYQCSVEGFGYKATATSRVKQRALAFALEDMARQMIEAAT
jgi:hypothetical protein